MYGVAFMFVRPKTIGPADRDRIQLVVYTFITAYNQQFPGLPTFYTKVNYNLVLLLSCCAQKLIIVCPVSRRTILFSTEIIERIRSCASFFFLYFTQTLGNNI